MQLLKSYISYRTCKVKQENKYKDFKALNARGSVVRPVLYLLYTRDIPLANNIKLTALAVDTAVLSVRNTIEETIANLNNTIPHKETVKLLDFNIDPKLDYTNNYKQFIA